MAFEAVLRDRLEDPIDFTVTDGTGIEKGTVCALSDPRTAAASTTAGEALAGIAAREKVASDGRTRLAIFKEGIFDMSASGGVTLGKPVISAGDNYVKGATPTDSGASILGYALETGTDDEVIQIMVNIGCGGGAA